MIPPNELFVEVVDPTRHGGQHVARTSTAIRVTHVPTGLSATADCRSQHRSRAVAIEMIEAALTSPTFRT